MTLYVIPETELPEPLPDHDIAIVVASDSEECRDALRKIDRACRTGRGRCSIRRTSSATWIATSCTACSRGIEGLVIPATAAVTRERLSDLSRSAATPCDIAADLAFPVIVRPRGSHAGAGSCEDRRSRRDGTLSRASGRSRNSSSRALSIMPAAMACFASTGLSSSMAGLTRVIMAIADRWDIWYLNAGMSLSASKRLEEADLHADIRHRLRAAASRCAGRHDRSDRARLFHGGLRGDQETDRC